MSKYSKIDPKLKAKWCKALRGKRFKQARSAFVRMTAKSGAITQHCCIAVGYVVSGRSPLELPHTENMGSFGSSATTRACNHLGLNSETRDKLVTMNDFRQNSYAEIANWIEKHL